MELRNVNWWSESSDLVSCTPANSNNSLQSHRNDMLGLLLTLCVIMVLLLPMPANRKDGSSVSEVQWCVVGPYGGDKVCTGSLSSPLTSQLHTLAHIKKKRICALTFV